MSADTVLDVSMRPVAKRVETPDSAPALLMPPELLLSPPVMEVVARVTVPWASSEPVLVTAENRPSAAVV